MNEFTYELVFLNFDDMYFTIGLFKTLEEANSYIEKALTKDCPLSWDCEDSEEVQLIEYKFGVGDNLRKTIREIHRSQSYVEASDEYIWLTTSDEIK